MQTEYVILVDEHNLAIGKMEKLETHQKGLLHRAFSVFVFNKHQELLLQKRDLKKYHTGGLWSNTCCSHPRITETSIDAAHRRLKEEMGFDCPLVKAFDFTYKTELENHLIEHEYDEVFFGIYSGKPKINKHEASEWQFVSLPALKKLMKESPGNYTPWLHIAFNSIEEFAKKQFSTL